MAGMEIGACSCDYDMDPVKVSEVLTPVSRKTRSCEECNKEIVKGERYVSISALVDDGWVHHTRCTACQSIAEDYCCSVVGYPGIVSGHIWSMFGLELGQGKEEDDDDQG